MLTRDEAVGIARVVVWRVGRQPKLKAVQVTQTRTESQVTIKLHYHPLSSVEQAEGETFIFNAEEL